MLAVSVPCGQPPSNPQANFSSTSPPHGHYLQTCCPRNDVLLLPRHHHTPFSGSLRSHSQQRECGSHFQEPFRVALRWILFLMTLLAYTIQVFHTTPGGWEWCGSMNPRLQPGILVVQNWPWLDMKDPGTDACMQIIYLFIIISLREFLNCFIINYINKILATDCRNKE